VASNHQEPGRRAALVLAHPGHELAILGWVRVAQPTLFVLTDGSGREGRSRINSTTQILSAVGGQPGTIYGRLSERQVYEALLAGATAWFVALAEELSAALAVGEFDLVVGDAAEGFQPTHDVFRLVLDAAIELARRATGRPLPSFEFPLFGRQSDCPVELRADAIWVELDEEGLRRKLAIAAQYAELATEFRAAMTGDMAGVLAGFPALAAAARSAIGELGADAYRIECLRPVPAGGSTWPTTAKPFYEMYGEALAGVGRVSKVVRFADHLLPVAKALARRLDASS
jgi:hypothetical protein